MLCTVWVMHLYFIWHLILRPNLCMYRLLGQILQHTFSNICSLLQNLQLPSVKCKELKKRICNRKLTVIIYEHIVKSVNYSKYSLTLTSLMWRIGWANNASKWQMGFNLALKGLLIKYSTCYYMFYIKCIELAIAVILGPGAAALYIILSLLTPVLSLQFMLFDLFVT
jgi:hypothetical protein